MGIRIGLPRGCHVGPGLAWMPIPSWNNCGPSPRRGLDAAGRGDRDALKLAGIEHHAQDTRSPSWRRD